MFSRVKEELQERLAAARQQEPRSESLLPEAVLRRLEKRSLATHGTLGGGLVGEHRGRRLASSLEFADYRPYSPGDDFRRVDWNAYARLNNLLVKIPESREDVAVHLLLDISRSMDWGEPSKLGYARQICAGLGYMSLCRLDGVRVAAVGSHVATRSPVFRGKTQAGHLFDYLRHLPVAPQTDLNGALAGYAAQHFQNHVAILVSDFLSPGGYEHGLARLLQAGFQLVVVHVLSRQELEPMYMGDLELLDAETGAVVEVTVGVETLRRYRREVEQWQESVRAACLSRGVRYIAVRTDRAIEQTLLGDFRNAGLLK